MASVLIKRKQSLTTNEHGETVYTVEEAEALKKHYLKNRCMTTEDNKSNWDTALTDAIEHNDGKIQPYSKILEFLSERYELIPKGYLSFKELLSQAWDASKDRESYLWDPNPWNAGPYIPKTKQEWMKENVPNQIEPTGKTGELSGNTEQLAASEKGLSMKDMCEHIVKAQILSPDITAQEIFNYSPSGELNRVFEWYAMACYKLGYTALQVAASDGLPCPPYCPKDEL